MGLPYPALRRIAWMLTGATVAFNGAASWPDLLASAMHGVIPVLFISITEAIRNAVAQAMDPESDEPLDSIPFSRWLLSPLATWSIRRDMRLWRIRSYRAALERYQKRKLYEQDLCSEHGWRWRSKASADELRPLRQARLGIAVAETTLPAGHVLAGDREERPALQPVSSRIEAPAFAPLPPVPATAGRHLSPVLDKHRPESAASRMPDAQAGPEPAVDAAPTQDVAEPAAPQDTFAPPAGPAHVLEPAPEAVEEPGPGMGGEPKDEAELHDEDGEHADKQAGEADAEDGAEQPGVDVGVAPPNETKSQKAQRIYLAHQKAGVHLAKPDLARWAGYKQEGSGRTQYVRLEKAHGPIVVREAADQLDFETACGPEGETNSRHLAKPRADRVRATRRSLS